MTNCPYCDGNNIIKSGFNKSGTQRYYCKNCKREFTKSTIKSIESIKCPKCKKNNYRKNGFTKQGVQRYVCKECGREFNANTSQNSVKQNKKEVPLLFKSKQEKNKIKKELEKKQKKSIREQKQLEKELKQKQLEEQKQKELELRKKEQEKQEQFELNKLLKSQKKRQEEKEKLLKEREERKAYINSIKFERRDLISEQNKIKLDYLFNMYLNNQIDIDKFNDNLNQIRVDIEEQIRLAIEIEKSHLEYNIKKDILTGQKLINISKKYNVALDDIKRRAEKYYKTETISETQKRLIIQYGVLLNTPVEYVAPYVPCSENMFYKITNFYKNKNFILPHIKLSVEDDDTVLNGFIPKDKSVKSVD